VVSDVAMVILSAGVGALAGVVTTAWKSRKDLEAQYDIDLRTRRVEAYSDLWKALEPLAYHFAARDLDATGAKQLGAALRRWYYATGGLVLSADSRPAYFNLQSALAGASADEVGDPEREILKALASRLRTSTTNDVATRVRARLGPTLAQRVGPAWHRFRSPVSIVVDRRWVWDAQGRRPCAFVIVRNLTARAVVVSSIEVQGAEPMTDQFVLQRNEEHEFTLPISGTAGAPVGPAATVVVNGGRRVTGGTAPPVPLPSRLVRPPAKAANSGKS
jgi:hypothetical protein